MNKKLLSNLLDAVEYYIPEDKFEIIYTLKQAQKDLKKELDMEKKDVNS